MSAALIAACLWFVAANLLAMLPSRDDHWTRAYWLIGCGVPLLGWATAEHGPLIGLVLLLAGGSILRWPLILLWRRLRRAALGRA
jgi:hypothetical protein